MPDLGGSVSNLQTTMMQIFQRILTLRHSSRLPMSWYRWYNWQDGRFRKRRLRYSPGPPDTLAVDHPLDFRAFFALNYREPLRAPPRHLLSTRANHGHVRTPRKGSSRPKIHSCTSIDPL